MKSTALSKTSRSEIVNSICDNVSGVYLIERDGNLNTPLFAIAYRPEITDFRSKPTWFMTKSISAFASVSSTYNRPS